MRGSVQEVTPTTTRDICLSESADGLLEVMSNTLEGLIRILLTALGQRRVLSSVEGLHAKFLFWNTVSRWWMPKPEFFSEEKKLYNAFCFSPAAR